MVGSRWRMVGFLDIVEMIYSWIFDALHPAMRVIAFSILLGTIGKCLSYFKSRRANISRVIYFIFCALWGAYKFGILETLELGEQVFQTIGLLLLLLVVIITYISRNITVFGYKVINYYTVWIFYAVILLILSIYEFRVNAITFSVFYCAISLMLVYGCARGHQV